MKAIITCFAVPIIISRITIKILPFNKVITPAAILINLISNVKKRTNNFQTGLNVALF